MYCLVRPWRLAAEPLEKVIDPPRSFEPLSNEMIAGVYVDLPQPPGPGVDELVRHAGRHHNDLPAPRLDNVVPSGEGREALLHHKDFLVGVPVQPRAAPGGASTTITETLAPRRRPWNSPASSPRAGSAVSRTRVTPRPPPTAPPPAWARRETAGPSLATIRHGPGPRCPAG